MPALLSEGLRADLKRLEEKLGYSFRNPDLLFEALVHRSFAVENGLDFDNERLEFLGDAFINFAVGIELFNRYSNEREGFLTRKRAEFVREKALAFAARLLGLGEFILFGKGERLQGGADRDSNLADAFEAVIGAVLLDGGIESAYEVLKRVLLSIELPPFRDYKSELYRLCRRLGLHPVFSAQRRNGLFRVQLELDGFKVVLFSNSKKEGEYEASKVALSYLTLRLPR